MKKEIQTKEAKPSFIRLELLPPYIQANENRGFKPPKLAVGNGA